MVAKQVYMNYIKENEKDKCGLFKKNTIYFLDTGQIEFKGVMIPTCEAVFRAEDRYKENFSNEMTQLFSSIKDNLWEQKIFMDLVELIAKSSYAMPKFTVIPSHPVYGMQTVTNDSFPQLCRMAIKAYVNDEDYSAAVEILKTFIYLIEQIPNYERLILDYLKGITEKYDMLLKSYTESIETEIENRATDIFHGDHYRAWVAAKNAVTVYEKLKNLGRKSPEIPKKKVLWLSLIKQAGDKMEFVLHSGKK